MTELSNQLVMNTINEFISNSLSTNANIPSSESDNVSKLIGLFFSPSVSLNPHDIMREMSDELVEHIIINRNGMPKHTMMIQIFQMFLIEWCYRNDQLFEDWKWEWSDDCKKGNALVNSKLPFSEIVLP